MGCSESADRAGTNWRVICANNTRQNIAHNKLVSGMERKEWVALIRFHLNQLAARNGHHEFERLAMEFARARIASNLLPATGPVSAGGDQGRDFETFRTYYVRDSNESGFRRRTVAETLSFACTLQQKGIARKIRDDVRKTMDPPEGKAGPRPATIFFFTATDVTAAIRHQLQDWACQKHGVELEIIDGQALAESLAEYDLHWIAATYLHLPRELAPPAPPAEDNDDYTRALQFWRTHEVNPEQISDFYEIKRWSRVAALGKRRLEDVPLWMDRLGAFASGAVAGGSVRDSLARSAVFERVLASAGGLGHLAGLEAEVRVYFADIASVRDAAELDDAVALLLHLRNVVSRPDQPIARSGIGHEDATTWRGTIEQALDAALQNPSGPNGRCMLLETRGLLALIPEPGTDIEAYANRVLGRYFDVIEAVPDAPMYPLGRFADRLTSLMHLLGDNPRFRDLTERVDALLADRAGPSAGAAKARDRAMVLLDRKEWLGAISQFQLAGHKWFAAETLWGAVASWLFIAECYRNLRLYSAAKLYALGAAFTASNSDQPRVLGLLPRAMYIAAEADYLQGAWLNFLGLHGASRLAFGVARNTREVAGESRPDDEHMDDGLTYALAVSWRIARRLAPELAHLFAEAAKRWDEVRYVEILMGRGVPWDDMTIEQIVASSVDQTGVAPLTDAGPERTIRWSALGIDWRVVFPNTYKGTARGEELAGILQIIQAELATRELALLPLSVELHLEMAAIAVPEISDLPPNGALRQFLIRIPVLPEEGIPVGEWLEREGLHMTGLIFYVLQNVSLLPHAKLMVEMEYLMQHNLGGKLMVARPYHELFTRFTNPEGFAEHERRSARWSSTAITWEAKPAAQLAWNDAPGPTYDQAKTLGWIRNRYENALPPVRHTVTRLRRSERFRRTLEVLRGEGWKDWHILLAVMNIAFNYRMQAERIDINAPGPEQLARLHAPEDEAAEPVPEEAFGPDAMRMMNDILQIRCIGQVGLELHQQEPTVEAINTFLSTRYRFWEDDVPHEDPFRGLAPEGP